MNEKLRDKTILSRLSRLEQSTTEELRELWGKLMERPAPAYNRSYLLKRLAYKLQEQAAGGLSERTKARLVVALEQNGLDPLTGKGPANQPKLLKRGMAFPPGFTIRKEWRGQIYTVIALEKGWWEMEGERFKSISAVAKAITGEHWNGYAFFGLRDYRTPEKKRRFNGLERISAKAREAVNE